MIVIVNTPLRTHEVHPAPFVVTLDTRTVFLMSRAVAASAAPPGKVHWAHREGSNGRIVAACNAAVMNGYRPWTGKPSQITCSKCKNQWWTNERILGSGGADFIQNGVGVR
jgi:hypothetical protein